MAKRKKVVKKVVKKDQPAIDYTGSFKVAFSEMWESAFLPAAKDLARGTFDMLVDNIGDVIKGTAGEAIGGGVRTYKPAGRRVEGKRPRRDYSRPSRERHQERKRFGNHRLSDIVFDDGREADVVADQLLDALGEDGYVTVAYFYDACGINPSHTDDNWGWYSLRGMKTMRNRAGEYYLALPHPETLE